MTVGIKIREQIDEMRRTGSSPLDISEYLGNIAIALDKALPLGDQIAQKDNTFSIMDGPKHSRRQALCSECEGHLMPSRNPKTNERIYVCQDCGHKTNPKIDVMTYSTRVTTVEGIKIRKMGASKLSGSNSRYQVAVEQDETNRNLYDDRKSVMGKKITPTGDDKRLQARSGVSITDIEQINPA